ncbi:hypothetical protein AXF42_Ash003177 [Apostasia shenzhenica]|uniref:Uncharacterized protein n=1 Tax=Apostasia shenzhenica TaxID=1088818 RepID=A0A2I0BFE1_9ASPA|nr:hypothetical protein AXF42_Ash003177 [Apostasia shenzhenica]
METHYLHSIIPKRVITDPRNGLKQKFRSITTLAALSVAVYVSWKLLRAPPARQRRQPRRSNQVPALSRARLSSNSAPRESEYCSSSADLRSQDKVDELFKPVTSQLLGVILEETNPEDLQCFLLGGGMVPSNPPLGSVAKNFLINIQTKKLFDYLHCVCNLVKHLIA